MNSLNLKKKIAFISSLAMLAATAAYLPADIAKQVGFGSSIVEAAAFGTVAQLDTVDLYVTVDGKYLAKSKTAATDYKLYDSIDDVESDYGAVALENTNFKSAASPASTAALDRLVISSTDTIKLPYEMVKGGSKIGVVAAAKTDKMTVISSVKSVEVTLDEHGLATVPKQSSYIIGQSDNSDYKNGLASNGAYEIVDLSGLKFKVEDYENNDVAIGSTAVNAAEAKYNGAGAALTKSFYSTSPDAEDETKSEYEFTKVGDIYARNVKIELTDGAPAGKVVVDLNPATNWTVTGTGVSSNKITLTISDDNKAQSGLITYAKGDQKEYYILNVENKVTELADGYVSITDANEGAGSAKVINGADLHDAETPASFTGGYKITRTTKAMSTNNNKQFVNVYTIHTNNADEGKHVYTLTGLFTDAAENSTLDANDKRVIMDIGQSTPDSTFDPASLGADTVLGTAHTATMTSKKGASYTSPVIEVSYQSVDTKDAAKWVTDKSYYIQVVITNEYELDFNTKVQDDNGKDVKVKAQVKGTTITRPEDPTKPGYTFKAYNTVKTYEDNSGCLSKGYKGCESGPHTHPDGPAIFVAGVATQQTTEITPNTKIEAVYDANEYAVTIDANGGNFIGNALTANNYVTVGVNDDNEATSGMKNVKSGEENIIESMGNTTVERQGYTFKGWAAEKNATEPLENLDKVRPAENNGKLTLYAVWEANPITINFEYINFDNGVAKSGTTDSDYSVGSNNMLFVNEDGGTVGENGVTYEYKTDANLGKLPTPVLKGYTFDGWYKKVTSKSGSVSAVRVTSLSKLTQEMLENSGTAATLYAKFKQNTYKITYDLDGGEFDKDAKPAATFRYVATTADENAKPKVKLINADGTSLKDIEKIKPSKGSGYYVFDGWTVISGDKSEKIDVEGDGNDAPLNKISYDSDVTVRANWKVDQADESKSSIALNTNGGDFYTVTDCDGGDGCSDFSSGETKKAHVQYGDGSAFKGFKENAGDSLAEHSITIDSDVVNNNGKKYIVARAGYTFTGWYTDKECTKLYSFSKFPAEGEEVTVYAGWKADTATRYHIQYNLVDADGAIVTPAEGQKVYGDYMFQKTFMAPTDSEVTAIGRTISYEGVKYVFDAKLSTGLSVTDTVTAEFNKDSLKVGKFENDSTKYVTLQAVFTDESVAPTALGTVNDTVVDTNGKVTWSAVDNAIAYKVVKKVGDKTYYSDKITATEYKFGSVPETAYSVRVVAFDKDGNKTWGKEVTVAAPVDPDELGEVKNVKVDADRKTVTWDKVDNAVTYKLVKKIGDKTYYTSEIADTSYTFGAATQGAFTVNVVAINVNGDRKWSDDVKVEAVKSNLGAAGNVKVGTDNKTLTWSAVDNAVSYRVAKIVGGKTYYTAKTTKLTTTLGSALKEGNKVYLIAYDKNGKSVTGPQTKISSVAKATKVAVAADGKTVTWTAAKNAAKYQVAKLINGKTYYGTKVDAKTTKYTFGSAATAGTQVFVITFDADGNSSYSDAVLVK